MCTFKHKPNYTPLHRACQEASVRGFGGEQRAFTKEEQARCKGVRSKRRHVGDRKMVNGSLHFNASHLHHNKLCHNVRDVIWGLAAVYHHRNFCLGPLECYGLMISV